MAQCRHVKPTGIVTNQNPAQPMDNERAHASRSTCDRPECIRNAQRWVASKTNETAVYHSFDAIRLARRGGAA